MLSATAFLRTVAIVVHVLGNWVLEAVLCVPMKRGALSRIVLRMLGGRLRNIHRRSSGVMATHTAKSRCGSGIRQRQTQQRQHETKEVGHFFSFA